jgi:hypothetical protein
LLASRSSEEFASLKATAKTIRAEAHATTTTEAEESVQESADRNLEGVVPSISDHRMSRYLFAVRNYLPRPKESVSESAVLEGLGSSEVS